MKRLLTLIALVVVAAASTALDEAAARPAPGLEGTLVYGACEAQETETDQYGCVVPPTGSIPVEQALQHTGTEVFLQAADGSTTRSTYNEMSEWGLEFSPSGKTMAFSSSSSGACRAYTAPVDGGPAVPLTPSNGDVCVTVDDWSSDGKWILLSNYWPEGGLSDVFKVRPDGSDLTRITNFCNEDTGSWSAYWIDGTERIVLGATVLRDGGRYDDGLYVIGGDGNEFSKLNGINVWDMVLAPDERSVYVATHSWGKRHGEIYQLNLEGKILRRLTYNNRDEQGLTLSPDGSKLLYSVGDLWVSGRDRGSDVAEGRVLDLRAGRTEPLRLPSWVGLSVSYTPEWAWSPDGTKIAVRTRERDETDRIVWTSVNGGGFGELVGERPGIALYGWLP